MRFASLFFEPLSTFGTVGQASAFHRRNLIVSARSRYRPKYSAVGTDVMTICGQSPIKAIE